MDKIARESNCGFGRDTRDPPHGEAMGAALSPSQEQTTTPLGMDDVRDNLAVLRCMQREMGSEDVAGILIHIPARLWRDMLATASILFSANKSLSLRVQMWQKGESVAQDAVDKLQSALAEATLTANERRVRINDLEIALANKGKAKKRARR